MAPALIIQTITGPYQLHGFVEPQDSNPDDDIYSSNTGAVFLVLDATIDEEPDFSANPTRSQVESGGTISDHVTPYPDKLTIRGIVSDTPVSVFRAPSNPFNPNNTPSPSQTAFDYLDQLRISRTPFDYVGGFKVYKNMVISNWKPVRNATTGASLQFTMTMEQVVTVETEVITQASLAPTVQKKASPKQSKGTQLTTNPSPFQSSSANSWFQDTTPTAGVQ